LDRGRAVVTVGGIELDRGAVDHEIGIR
jgi:hypothetical protein